MNRMALFAPPLMFALLWLGFAPLSQALPGLPYESIPGELQVEMSDENRVPQVEFDIEPMGIYGTLLKETDYHGEGQFPLAFTRFHVPSTRSGERCGHDVKYNLQNYSSQPGFQGVYHAWSHTYSSCIISHLYYAGPASNRTLTVCSQGICTIFEETLKPRRKDVRDTLVRNGVVNGKIYPYVYTNFKTGIKEAFNGYSLLARFDRSGIEHRLTYSSNYLSVTHIPSGKKLILNYPITDSNSLMYGSLKSMTDPQGNVFTYHAETSPDKVIFPKANSIALPLERSYTFGALLWGSHLEYFGADGPFGFIESVKEQGQIQLAIKRKIQEDFYGKEITKVGHNAQPQIQSTYPVAYGKMRRIDYFSDTDTSAYRSSTTHLSIKSVNGDDYSSSSIKRITSVDVRCADCTDDYKSYTWDTTTGDLLTRTDYLGRVTKFVNDPRGLPLTEIEAYGTAEARTTTRTWDSRFPLMTSETLGGITRDWRYNPQGHVVKEIVRPSSVALVSDSCPAGSTTCHQTVYGYTYNPSNNVITRKVTYGPRYYAQPRINDVTITDYRPNGDLWKVTNGKGQLIDEVLAVNAHGQVTQRRDLNGRITTTAYNNLRQPISETVTGGDVTKWDYTINGRLKTYTKPDGSLLTYTYNPAGSVKTVSQTVGGITDKVEYFRDSRGKILETRATKTGGVTQSWKQIFDLPGRLYQSYDGTGTWYERNAYNLNNLKTQGCVTSQICFLTGYTGLDQLNTKAFAPMLTTGALGPQKLLFDLGYDGAGRVNSVVDSGGVATGIINNEIDKQTRQNSADFGIRMSIFDLAGNETRRVDQDGNTATKYYDVLNRLYQTDYSDGGKLTQTWDVSTLGDTTTANYPGRQGQRSRINADAAGTITVTDGYIYNFRGDVTAAHQSVGALPKLITQTTYVPGADDETGKPRVITYPGGLQVVYTYGAHGKPIQVDATLAGVTSNLAKNITWQPLIKRLSKLTFGNGYSYERSRDAGGRINAIRVNNAAGTPAYAIGVGYNARNQVSSYGWQFTYDDLGHLSGQYVNSTTDKRRWTLRHDLNGNLEQQDIYNAAGALVRHDVLTYPPTNNRVASEAITPAPPADGTGGSNVANVYDQSGYLIQQGPVSYQYDAARQMKRYQRAGVNVRYVYDAARQRVLKTGTFGTTRFVYDQAGHLIYEVTPNGSTRNTVWLGDIPLAIIDQNAAGAKAATYFIETDFSNTPRYLRPAVGDLTKVVWYWQVTPYGDFPATDGLKLNFNLRYPGQYYDAESKLHYNHTRYFQPRTGRYLQPDLIGLEGGINVYTYAGGNPVMYMDPTGTFWQLITAFFSMLGFGLETQSIATGEPPGGSMAGSVAKTAEKAAVSQAVKTAQSVSKGATQDTAKVGALIATHGKTMSNKQLDKLTKNIRAEGVKQPLTVTEQQGKLYILDGHHRALAASRAGVSEVPINRVELPYGAYKTPTDLIFTPGGY